MAEIATVNTSDKVLILGAREAFMRQVVGTTWNDLLIGMFYTFVPTLSNDSACATETRTISDNGLDRYALGMKDSSTNLPFAAGSQFIGSASHHSHTSSSQINTNASGTGSIGGNGGSDSYFRATDGTTNLVDSLANGNVSFPQFSATNVNAFWGLRLTVNNPGLSSQSISISKQFISTAQVDVGIVALQNLLLGGTWSGQGAFTWNVGGSAMPLPTHMFFRVPFLNNRLRITTYGAIRLA